MPTKRLVASASAVHLARRAADFGVKIPGDVTVDMKAVKARAKAVVSRASHGVESWLEGMKTCTIYRGHARFESASEVRVGDTLLEGERIFLNVGGRAIVPDMPGVDQVPFLNNR